MVRTIAALAALANAAWTPQQHRAGTWQERIQSELEDSLKAYARVESDAAAEALVDRILGDKHRLVLVLGRSLIVDASLFLHNKGLHHVEFVKSVLERDYNRKQWYV